MSKLMITAAEVAEIMDCSERHGYKLIQEMNGVNGIIKVPTFGGENSPPCYA